MHFRLLKAMRNTVGLYKSWSGTVTVLICKIKLLLLTCLSSPWEGHNNLCGSTGHMFHLFSLWTWTGCLNYIIDYINDHLSSWSQMHHTKRKKFYFLPTKTLTANPNLRIGFCVQWHNKQENYETINVTKT